MSKKIEIDSATYGDAETIVLSVGSHHKLVIDKLYGPTCVPNLTINWEGQDWNVRNVSSRLRAENRKLKQGIQETLTKIENEINKSRAYHEDQMKQIGQPNVIIRHHETILDYIDNELMQRIAMLNHSPDNKKDLDVISIGRGAHSPVSQGNKKQDTLRGCGKNYLTSGLCGKNGFICPSCKLKGDLK